MTPDRLNTLVVTIAFGSVLAALAAALIWFLANRAPGA